MKYLVARTLVNAVEREPIRTMGENLNKTEGILLIGTLLASTAYGITTMQTYMWYRNYPKESMLIRAVVWSLFILDTLHIALSMHVIYYYLILNFDNPAALKLSVWSFDSTIALTAVITCIAHGFYARRVYILANRNWFLPTVIAILSGIRLVFGCIIVKRLLVIKVVAELPHKIGMIVGISMGSASLADWIITAALVILLRRRRSGVRDTDHLLDKLTYWTVNNGLLTSILGVCVIVTLVAMPDNMIYFAIHLLLSKLYANSLLATLNYRKVARGRGIDDTMPMHPLSQLRPNTSPPYNSHDSAKGMNVVRPVVHVMTTTVTDSPLPSETTSELEEKHC